MLDSQRRPAPPTSRLMTTAMSASVRLAPTLAVPTAPCTPAPPKISWSTATVLPSVRVTDWPVRLSMNMSPPTLSAPARSTSIRPRRRVSLSIMRSA